MQYASDNFPEPYRWLPNGLAPVNTTVLADFNGDNFHDIATNIGAGTMRIITAQDVNQPSMGLRYGPPLDTPAPFLAMAASDFNADGKMDIAAAYFDASASTGQLAIYTVDPQTLAITLVTAVAVPAMGPGDPALGPSGTALAAGKFLTGPGSQLVMVVNAADGSGVQMTSYSFDSQLRITQRSTTNVTNDSVPIVVARSGRFELGAATEQLVVGYGSAPIGASLNDSFQIFTFDDQLNFQVQSTASLGCSWCLADVAIGNFTQSAEPTLQIAILTVPLIQLVGPGTFDFDAFSVQVSVYNVTPETLETSLAATSTIDSNAFPSSQGQVFRFAAGDTLGQSLLVGPPMKVSIDAHIQPTVVLAMPPMHVDLVPPVGSSQPEVLNITAVHDGFASNYQTVVTSDSKSQWVSTTSYSFGAIKSEGGGGANSISVIGASLLGFSGTTQTAVGNVHARVVQNQYDTYQGSDFDASTFTGFSDFAIFKKSRFNLWIYPVLSQTVCPASQPQCDESEKLPAAVIFSGPDQVCAYSENVDTQEWYQPTHEPGNVLSYPATSSQLAAAYEGFNQLGVSPIWSTDTSTQTQLATLSEVDGDDATSGSVAVHSRDKTASVHASILGFGGGEDVDNATSDAFGTVNETVTTVRESSGIGIVKPGTFLNPPDYEYPVQTFIFGQNDPAGTAQTIQIGTKIQATGALRSAFIADPSGQLGQAGIWWQQTYTVPDVALNHPVRWTVVSTTKPTGANCLRIGPNPTASDCASFNEPDLNDLPASEFYWIRGFFITPARSNGLGPQITEAIAGEQLLLQVRVYNYSLAEMAEGTTVRVRFYGQPVDSNGDFSAPSFLIGEDTLDRIPPFNAGPNPNWMMASTTFDPPRIRT